AFERAVTLATSSLKSSRSGRTSFFAEDALYALAVAYRRARRFDDAATCWTTLVESGCSSAIEHEAIEALAIHHEHRRRDLEAAKLFAMENVVRARKGARHRLDRIERKLAGGGGRLL